MERNFYSSNIPEDAGNVSCNMDMGMKYTLGIKEG